MIDVLLILHKVLVEILASIVVGSMVDDLFAQTVLQRLHRLFPSLVVVKVGMNLVVLVQQVSRFTQQHKSMPLALAKYMVYDL